MNNEKEIKIKEKNEILHLTEALAIGVGVSLFASCTLNNPTKYVCPITTILTPILGYEKALEHQMKDLENYNRTYTFNGKQISCKVGHVSYFDSKVSYVVPKGYMLTQDAKGNVIGYKEVLIAKNETTGDVVSPSSEYVLLEDGSVKIEYKVPEGYTLEKKIETIEPQIVVGGTDKVIYDYILSENDVANIFSQSWSYVDGKFITQNEVSSPKLGKYIK